MFLMLDILVNTLICIGVTVMSQIIFGKATFDHLFLPGNTHEVRNDSLVFSAGEGVYFVITTLL